MPFLLTIFLMLCTLASADISYVFTHTTQPDSNFYDWDVQENIIVNLYVSPTDRFLFASEVNNTNPYQLCFIFAIAPIGPEIKMKTYRGNQCTGLSVFLGYSITQLYFFQQLGTVNNTIFQVPNPATQVIIDGFFGTNSTQIFVLVSDNQMMTHLLIQIVNSVITNYTDTKISNSTSFIKSMISQNKLYYLFSDMLTIFTDGLSHLLSIPSPSPSSLYSPVFDTANNTLIFCQQFICKLSLISGNYFVDFGEILLTEIVQDAKIRGKYAYILSLSGIKQIDLDIGNEIVKLDLDMTGKMISITNDRYIFVYSPYNTYYKNFTVYQYNSSYGCSGGCISCHQTYQLNRNTLQCVKNYSIKAVIISKTWKMIAQTLSIASTRITPKFVLSAIFYFDQLSYYAYHNCEYPQQVSSFFHRLDLLNQIRLSPQFFTAIDSFRKQMFGQEQNRLYWLESEYGKNNPEGVYFYFSVEDTYKINLLLNVILFIFLKCLQIVLLPVRHRHRFFSKMYLFIWENCRGWVFATMVIESNVMNLTFYCLIQIMHSFSFQFVNKVCIVVSMLVLGFIFCYATVFYPFVFLYGGKAARNLLIRTKYCWQSFFVESFYGIGKNFLRAFLHAGLRNYYPFQIAVLGTSDFIFVFGLFYYQNYFLTGSMFFCSLCLNVYYLLFDSVLILHNRWPQLFQDLDYPMIACLFLFGVICFIIALSLSILYYTIYQIIFSKGQKNNICQHCRSAYSISSKPLQQIESRKIQSKSSDKQTLEIPVKITKNHKMHENKSQKKPPIFILNGHQMKLLNLKIRQKDNKQKFKKYLKLH